MDHLYLIPLFLGMLATCFALFIMWPRKVKPDDTIRWNDYVEIEFHDGSDVAPELPAGWQGWEGEDRCPVPYDTEVRVMCMNGSIFYYDEPQDLRWYHMDVGSDIVAWRVA